MNSLELFSGAGGLASKSLNRRLSYLKMLKAYFAKHLLTISITLFLD